MGTRKRIMAFLLMVVDAIIISLAYAASYYIRLSFFVEDWQIEALMNNLPIIIGIYVISLAFFKMYRSIWRIAGIDEVVYGVMACIMAGIVNFGYMELLPVRVPRMTTILACILITIGVLAVRLSYRFLRKIVVFTRFLDKDGKENALIIGAGSCGQILISEIKEDKDSKYNIVGLIDDDINKKGIYLKGLKVIGGREQILTIVKERAVDVIFIAISSIDSKKKIEIIDICKEAKVKMKIIPGMAEILKDKSSLKQMRDVDLKDLLGREEVKLDKTGISEYLTGKRVLVTGAGGSIGSELVRQITLFKPKQLILLDIYENNIYDIQNELSRNYPELNKEIIIASVRDRKRLEEIFNEYKPQVVFHAAAHKHVPLMEFSPQEAIKNNVVGTLNVAECASKFKTERFVLISTDKAVNPTNVMGATKRLCEMIIQAIDKESETEFVAVRFGNVLGSNGSVIPLFQKQIKEGGPLTLTHKNITRYFMLIPEAAQLVLQAGGFANGGEIFVLDMGEPVKIYDLAENLIKLSGFEPHKEIEIKVTGLRPGEKLYEELLMNEEGLKETSHEQIFIGIPSEFNLAEVKESIDSLLTVAVTGDKERLKIKLKEVVPTYVDPSVINEVAATKK